MKKCVKLVIRKNYNEMHGQQNIKKPTINISNVSLSLSKYLYGVLAESSLQQNLRANTFNVILKSFNLPQ
jgi:hypothetical protein